MNLKFYLKGLLIAFVFGVTSIYAIPRGPCDESSDEVCCEEPPPGPFAFSFPRDLYLSCPRDFYVNGDFLLMQAKQEGLEFAKTQSSGTNTFPFNGGRVLGFSDNGHDWGWNLGFRLGFGFHLNHDAWNVDAKWTYLRIKEDHSEGIQSGIMLPLWLPPSTALNANNREASARWTGYFNTLDLALGKPHHISRYFVLNPFFAIRSAWIQQDYHARYGGQFQGSQNGAEMIAENNFWGVGARTGINADFLFGSGWTFFGNMSASMLFGKFDITQEAGLSGTSGDLSFDEEHKFYQNVPNLEIMTGVAWHSYFDKNRYLFTFKLAYEFHQWWNQNRMRRFFDNANVVSNKAVSKGNLTLNGLSFRLSLEF